MPESVSFFVPGVPQPGGSKKGFVVPGKGGKPRAVVVEDAKHNAPWRAVVALAAREAILEPFAGPVMLTLHFIMPRPAKHYGAGRRAGVLKDSAPHAHTGKPDLTKLIRSTEDALKGLAWADDAQVAEQVATKLYGERPGCVVTVAAWLDVEQEDRLAAKAAAGVIERSLVEHLPEPLAPRLLADLEARVEPTLGEMLKKTAGADGQLKIEMD